MTSYAYNLAKQLTQVTRPDGSKISISYDPVSGRPTSLVGPQMNRQYTYLPTGQLDKVSQGSENLSVAYDGAAPSQLTWSGTVSGSVSILRVFDNLVHTRTVSFPGLPAGSTGFGNQIVYDYNPDFGIDGSGGFRLIYDPTSGNLNEVHFNTSTSPFAGVLSGLSVNEQYSYDSYGAVASITSQNVDGSYQYAEIIFRDNSGRIIEKQEYANPNYHDYLYSYDLAGRLTQVTIDGVVNSTYVYDQNSNRILLTTPTNSIAGTIDAQDKLLQYGSVVYSYNGNGELISKLDQSNGNLTQYAYDGSGELISVNLPNGKLISYTYDGMGNRVAKSVNGVLSLQYLYDENGSVVASLDGNGNPINFYLYHKSATSPDGIYHYSGPLVAGQLGNLSIYEVIEDHLGSPKLIRDISDGSIQREMDFDEFGVLTNDTNPGLSDFGFAGCLYDVDTQLCHFKAREYDASTGRFLTRDPIGFAGGLNQYDYSLNDPVNLVDPTGLASCSYSISTRSLVCTGSLGNTFSSNQVYSGRYGFTNDQSATGLNSLGPIPTGTYNIGNTYSQNGFQRNNLTPLGSTNTMGRTGFEIHGCSNGTTCSKGCLGVYGNSNLSGLENLLNTDTALGQSNVLEVTY